MRCITFNLCHFSLKILTRRHVRYYQDSVSPGGGGNRYMGNNICSLSPGDRHYSRNQIEQMNWVLLAKLDDICMCVDGEGKTES